MTNLTLPLSRRSSGRAGVDNLAAFRGDQGVVNDYDGWKGGRGGWQLRVERATPPLQVTIVPR